MPHKSTINWTRNKKNKDNRFLNFYKLPPNYALKMFNFLRIIKKLSIEKQKILNVFQHTTTLSKIAN